MAPNYEFKPGKEFRISFSMGYPEMFFRAKNPNDKRPIIPRTFTFFYGKIGLDGTGTFTDVRTMHWDDTENSRNTFNKYLRE